MCGRMVRASPAEVISAEFGLELSREVAPRYNLCPSEDLLAIVHRQGQMRFCTLRWGLVPAFAKDPKGGPRAINARAETVTTRPAFRDAFRSRRCLIVADGFYEWQRDGQGRRTPYFVRLRARRPFAFAGLWDRWSGEDGTRLWTCTVVTCPPNALLAPIHDRMPVILPRGARDRWVGPRDDPESLLELLAPYPDDELEAYPVSRLVNSPRNDVPECITRAERPAG